GTRMWTTMAWLFAIGYLGLGLYQREHLENCVEELMAVRGHAPIRQEVKPALGNLWLWRPMYEHEGYFYMDGLRKVPWTNQVQVYEGNRIKSFDPLKHAPALLKDSVQANDIERFRWFSDGFLSLESESPLRIG